MGPLLHPLVDVIFAKAKPQDAPKMEYRDFLRALAMIATEMKKSYEEVVEMLGCEPLPLDVAWAAPSRSSSRRTSLSGSEDRSLRRSLLGMAPGVETGSYATSDDQLSQGGRSGARFFQGYYQSEFGPKRGTSNLAPSHLTELPKGDPQRMAQFLDQAARATAVAPEAAPGTRSPGNGQKPQAAALAPRSSLQDAIQAALAAQYPQPLPAAAEPLARVLQAFGRAMEDRLGALEERMASVEQEAYLARVKAQEAQGSGRGLSSVDEAGEVGRRLTYP